MRYTLYGAYNKSTKHRAYGTSHTPPPTAAVHTIYIMMIRINASTKKLKKTTAATTKRCKTQAGESRVKEEWGSLSLSGVCSENGLNQVSKTPHTKNKNGTRSDRQTNDVVCGVQTIQKMY